MRVSWSRWARGPKPGEAVAFLRSKEKTTSKDIIAMEDAHAARNYSPLPVVFSKASGITVTDPEGKKYFDFLSGYGTVSQGHRNKAIAQAMIKQLKRCTLSSRAFFSSNFGRYSKFITTYFGYDRVLAMNSGAEGVETAFKLARKWGYDVKKIRTNQAIIVCCEGNFHGRTTLAVSLSDDPSSYEGFGPYVPNIVRVPYGDAQALEKVFKAKGPRIAGFIVEPIQGEAGIIIPPEGYLQKARQLCTRHNILLIADEVQCGIGRSGALLASQLSDVRPDVVILAKALGGGFMPVSAVLADDAVMKVFTPGTHGSTFGGNPIANEVAMAALTEIHQKGMVANARKMGQLLLSLIRRLPSSRSSMVTEVRGRGLFLAIDFNRSVLDGKAAVTFMQLLKNRGVLAKVTHGHTLRMSPPLVITRAQVVEAARRIGLALEDLAASQGPSK